MRVLYEDFLDSYPRYNMMITNFDAITILIPSQFPESVSWQVLKAMPSFQQVEAEMEEWRNVGAESWRKEKY